MSLLQQMAREMPEDQRESMNRGVTLGRDIMQEFDKRGIPATDLLHTAAFLSASVIWAAPGKTERGAIVLVLNSAISLYMQFFNDTVGDASEDDEPQPTEPEVTQ